MGSVYIVVVFHQVLQIIIEMLFFIATDTIAISKIVVMLCLSLLSIQTAGSVSTYSKQ